MTTTIPVWFLVVLFAAGIACVLIFGTGCRDFHVHVHLERHEHTALSTSEEVHVDSGPGSTSLEELLIRPQP